MKCAQHTLSISLVLSVLRSLSSLLILSVLFWWCCMLRIGGSVVEFLPATMGGGRRFDSRPMQHTFSFSPFELHTHYASAKKVYRQKDVANVTHIPLSTGLYDSRMSFWTETAVKELFFSTTKHRRCAGRKTCTLSKSRLRPMKLVLIQRGMPTQSFGKKKLHIVHKRSSQLLQYRNLTSTRKG